MSISIIFPIEFSNQSLGMPSFSDANPTEAIKQNLKMLLLTREGEYPMDKDFGVGLPEYLFELDTRLDLGALESKIRDQANTYMPYMTISSLDLSIVQDKAALFIRIGFFYNGLTKPNIFELEVN